MLLKETTLSKFRPVRAITALALALVLVIAPLGIGAAKAEGGLNISTPYPGITINTGDDATFTLNVENESTTPQNVSLSVDEKPDGWDAYFTGDGNPITRVYVNDADSDDNNAEVDLVVSIPDDAKVGDYTIKISGAGQSGFSDTLELNITISEEQFTKGKIVCNYPQQQGSSDTTFTYSLTLTNNSSKAQSYALSATTPDKNWQVEFENSDGVQISSLSLESGRGATVKVSIDPPDDVAAGSYGIPFSAVSAEETRSADLTAVITGTYGMTLSTPSGNLALDAEAGKKSSVTLTITNSGTADLTNIQLLTSSEPTDWEVSYEKTTIESLAAGDSVEVIAYVQPAHDAVNGDYVVSIKAKTDQVTTSAAFRVTVKTSTIWGIVGIAIVAVVVVALILIFRKFGRR
jgi:uncharacterized membrane protein